MQFPNTINHGSSLQQKQEAITHFYVKKNWHPYSFQQLQSLLLPEMLWKLQHLRSGLKTSGNNSKTF
jgi:hypothetical protein